MMHAIDQEALDGAKDDARDGSGRQMERWMMHARDIDRAKDDARDGLERQHAMDQADID